jgi:hypothetical protein
VHSLICTLPTELTPKSKILLERLTLSLSQSRNYNPLILTFKFVFKFKLILLYCYLYVIFILSHRHTILYCVSDQTDPLGAVTSLLYMIVVTLDDGRNEGPKHVVKSMQ